MAGVWFKLKERILSKAGQGDIDALTREIDALTRFSTLESLTFIDDPLLEQANVKEEVRDLIIRCARDLMQEENFVIRDRHKIINDPVHGTVYIHPLAILIMDTPQFQRLHYVKQLSALLYVYPSADYSRFEHSVGVYHLAGKVAKVLKDQQPKLGISAIDAMCVQLAGLCHDLGHGPFSHMFDRGVIPALSPGTQWTHEQASIDLLDHIYKMEHIRQGFAQWGFTERDFNFVKSMITCQPKQLDTGRGEDKSFLYEIVANDRSGMDVDKWDFLVRDSFHLGIKCGFEHTRLMCHLRAIEVDGEVQICVRDKEADSINTMFFTRYELYKKAYQHPVSSGVEMLITEALIKAGKHLKVGGKTLVECIDDMEAYTKLHDGIFFKILDSEGEELKESREMLERIQKRQLWKHVGIARITKAKDEGKDIGREMVEELKQKTGLDFRSRVSTRNFGKQDSNPLDFIRFYKKSDPGKAFSLSPEQRLYVLPKEFQHTFLVLYCTSSKVDSNVYELVKKMFKERGLPDSEFQEEESH